MNEYKIQFYVYPYSGAKRTPVDYETHRKQAGKKYPEVSGSFDDFEAALKHARSVLEGIKLDERVWEAGIKSITCLD